MRNISFALTTAQFKARAKTVTRRLGWEYLKPGDHLMGCEKCQGLKAGEKIVRLGEIVVVSVRREPLDQMTADDCVLEGFPELSRQEFGVMFMHANKCSWIAMVTRIEFAYVGAGE